MLVVTGLIVGGILVGRDLISAAAVRAQISQIDQYQQAVNTFRGKYGYLPGDIPDPDASRFGFTSCMAVVGQGNGNGLLTGGYSGTDGDGNPYSNHCGAYVTVGELGLFWRDLSTAKLIEGNFTLVSAGADFPSPAPTGTAIGSYLPHAKLAENLYVYVWSGGWKWGWSSTCPGATDNTNYFAVSKITSVVSTPQEIPAMTAAQAYAIDGKMDDGLPQYGRVLAMTAISYGWWGGAATIAGDTYSATTGDLDINNGGPVTNPSDINNAALPDTSTCYDGSLGLPEHYSVTRNNGMGMNCALSIKMQ